MVWCKYAHDWKQLSVLACWPFKNQTDELYRCLSLHCTHIQKILKDKLTLLTGEMQLFPNKIEKRPAVDVSFLVAPKY